MRQEYLNSIKAGAIEGWYKYKITPSLTAAQAALESGWGTSKLAAPPYNNNFGIKAGADWTGKTASMSTQEWNGSKFITIVDTFRAYDSINDSVEDHGAFFTSTEWRINNYRNVVGEGDYKKACYAVANAGYATDPNYATKLINIIETYNLQSWDIEAQNGNPNNEALENTKASKIVGGSISSAASQAVSSLLLSMIGDSLGVGTEKFLRKYPWAKAFYDNLGSRQWTHATASLDATKVLQTMINNNNLQQNVVFILGTNRGVNAEEIDNVVSMCGRDRNIILVDTASEVNHRNTVSNAYREASKRHQNVFYANWSDYARANIATWYHADGANGTRIHMKDTGYQKHAEFIIQAVYEAANTNWVEEVSTPTEKNTERVNIYDVEYDDGKYTSPKGDSSIYNKGLNDQLGFRPKKAQIMWIERKYTGEEDNAADLLEAALKKMDEYSVPAAQYTVPMRYFPSEVSIGDTGYFIDHEFNPPLYIFARVLSMTTSVTNPGNDSVVIGNVIEVHPKDKADILALQKELQENREEARLEYWKIPPIVLQMISSNGLNFKTKPGELYSDLVHSTVKNPEVKNGSVDIPVHNAKKVGARISITGSIKDNYIDIVDEITNEINAPIPEEVFTGPVDPNSNPQGNTVKDITAPLDVRQLIVKQLDVQLLDSAGLNMGTKTLSVYEDSTFALKVEGLPKHINKIRILSNQNLILDDISALDTSDPVSGAADKTRLYVKAFQEDTEVTHKFKNFSWSRISSNKRLDEEWNDANKFNETNGIDLTPADVFGNESTFVCKMFDENGKFIAATSSSVTITKEGNKNTISDSTMPPRDPSPGDKWTSVDGDLEEEYYYVDGEWVQTGVSKKVDAAIAEAEQAKADAIKAYEDAIAEAERLVIESDTVWQGKMDDYNKQVAQIEADAQSAQDKADQALIDVGISTDLAQTAKDLATTAKNNASQAQVDASAAVSDASAAVTNANQAKADAQTALTDASTALTDASTALSNSTQAKTDATEALTKAGLAQADATQAKADASQAKVEAQSAVTQAGQAITSANTAKTNAQTAINDSQTAISDAQSALTTAGSAKSSVDALTITVNDLEGEVELKASQTEVDGLSGTVSTHSTTISQQATAIASKADKTVVDTLSGTVSNQGTLISQNATDIATKASSQLVDTIKDTVDTHTTEISQNATDIATKASSTSVSALTGRVSTAETTISQNSEAIESKASQTEVDGISGIVSTHSTTLSQHATAISSKASSEFVDTIKETVDTHTTEISQNATDIASKASTSSVNLLTGRVSKAETSISQNATDIASKASQTDVDDISGTVSTHTTTLSQHATQIASKASSELVNTIKGTVDTHTTEIAQNATDISSKASTSSVNTLTGRVDTAESNISQNATAITQRVTTTTYNAGIASKENSVLKQSTAPAHANGRLWLDTSKTPNILKRSNGTTWIKATPTTPGEVGAYSQSDGAGLAGRLTTAETNITQTATAITSKADKSTVDTLAGTVSTQGTTIAQQADLIESKANQSEVDTVKGTVSGHTTTLSQHATQIASKAESSLVNTIKGTVDTHTTEISQNATAIASKASTSSVNTLTGRVSTAESNISQNATAISARLTSSQVNSLVDGKGLAKTTYVDTQIKASADGIRTDMTRVEGKIDELQVGGRNLVLNSSKLEASGLGSASGSQAEYQTINVGQSYMDLEDGEIITVSFDIEMKIATANPTLMVYNTNRKGPVKINTGQVANQIRGSVGETINKRISFTTSATILANPTYNYNTVEFYSEYGSNNFYRISKLKIERGNKATDWTPAPEDTVMENDFTVFKNSYQSTVNSINTELSKTAKKTDLNGMVTESVLATKQFVTQGSMTTTLSNYAQVNGVPTNNQFNTLKNRYDSMEQTIGTNGSKIAQMVMTDKLFRTTVRDNISTDGVNLIKGSNTFSASDGIWITRYNTNYSVGNRPGPRGHTQKVLEFVNTQVASWIRFNGVVNSYGTYTFSAWIRRPSGSGVTIAVDIAGDDITYKRFSVKDEWQKIVVTRTVSAPHDLNTYNFVQIRLVSPYDNVWFFLTEPKLEMGDIATPYSVAPTDNALQSQVTQLEDSWALTLKSGNDIKTQINATTDGIRLASNLIYLSGQSMIDSAVIKSAHIESLNANKITGNTADFNTIRAGVLTANAVSATHINGNTALFDKLFSTTSATTRLVAQGAWIENANIKSLNADKITAGTIRTQLIGRNYASNTSYIATTPNRNNNHLFTQPLDLGVYTLTFYAKANTATTAQVYLNDDRGAGRLGATCSPNLISIGTGWQKYTIQVNVSKFDRNDIGKLFVRVYGTSTTSLISTKEFMFAKGYAAMDYLPAPEDNPTTKDLSTYGSVTIHGGNITASTIDVGKITGDTAKFISLSFESLNSNMKLGSGAIRIQNSAGDFATMNTIPEFRSQDSGGTAAIMGKGRSHYYSGNQARFYIGSNLEGLAQYGVHIAKGQTWGIYRNSDTYGGTPAQYYNTPRGWGAVQVVEELMRLGYVTNNFTTASAHIRALNGWGNSWPVLQPGEPVMYKAAVAGNSSGVERIWTMGTSSNGSTRTYSHVHHVFEGGTTGTSDARLKHNIEPTAVTALNHIEALTFKQFNWNRDNKFEPLGLIAQHSGILRVPDEDMEGIDIQRAIMLALKGIQELQEEIKQLKEIINQ